MKKLLLLKICILAFICNSYSQVPTVERNALIAIYNVLDGPNWGNSTNWNTNNPVNTWEYVSTAMVNNQEHVVSLNFTNNSDLSGNFPTELTDLTELKLFIAEGANLSGTIPSNIGNLTNLETFAVGNPGGWGNNQISGSIPASIVNCTQLTGLGLNHNKLSGDIPDLTGLPNLDILWVNGNHFEFGDFEDEFNIYNTLNFQYLNQRLIGNEITEIVPVNSSYTITSPISGNNNIYEWYHNGTLISGATNSTLQVTINNANDYGDYVSKVTNTVVTGLELESEIIMLDDYPNNKPEYPFLTQLYSNTNGSSWNNNTNWLDNTKPLHDWKGIDMKNGRLNSLILIDNNLDGSIPSNIDLLSEAKLFRLDINQLTGNIPSTIGNLTNLEILALQQNQLTGNIPTSIGNLINLTMLWLDYNLFSGSIPSQIGNLTSLNDLFLDSCGLSGNVPSSFENLVNLEWLSLSGYNWDINGISYSNNLSGDLPDFTNMPYLGAFTISHNQFEFADIANEYDYYVNNIPQFSFNPQYTTDTEDDIYIQPGDDVTLTVNYQDPTGKLTSTSTYQWYKDDIIIPGATNSLYDIQNAQVSDNGDYYCKIVNSAYPDFEIQRRMIHLNVGGLDTQNIKNEIFTFFPNPVKETLNLKLQQSDAQIQLYNIQGKVVLERKHITQNEVKLNLSSLSNGTYFLKVRMIDGSTSVKKIIKE